MLSAFPSRLRWHTKKLFAYLGWPLVSALMLALFAGVFMFSILNPLQRELTTLQRKLDQPRVRPALETNALPNANDLIQQLAAFYRFFPARDSAADWIAKLYEAAAAQNLALEQGEYRLLNEPGKCLLRYAIVLPVKGSYLAIRAMLAQALAAVPALSLDGVTFNRPKLDDPLVEAQLRFTLYLVAQ